MTPETFGYTPPETESEKRTLGQIIRGLREFYGYTQARIASGANISQGYFSQIELDDPLAHHPGYQQWIGLAKALGVGINFDLDQQEQRAFILPQALQIYSALYRDELRIMIGTLREKFNIGPEDSPITYIDYSPSYKQIGARILDLRHNHPDHLTQLEVGLRSGTSQPYISQIERSLYGTRNPSMTNLRAIANALDIDIYDLLEIKEVEYPPGVAYLNRFFRSNEVPVSSKVALVKLVEKMEAVPKTSSSS